MWLRLAAQVSLLAFGLKLMLASKRQHICIMSDIEQSGADQRSTAPHIRARHQPT